MASYDINISLYIIYKYVKIVDIKYLGLLENILVKLENMDFLPIYLNVKYSNTCMDK